MSALKEELDTDPLGIGYSLMSDSEVADSLNLANREIDVPAPMRSILAYLITAGKFKGIQTAATGASDLSNACAGFLFVANNVNFSDLDLTHPAIASMFDTMKAGAVISESDQAAILSLGKKIVSRAEEIGISRLPVKPGHVQGARS